MQLPAASPYSGEGNARFPGGKNERMRMRKNDHITNNLMSNTINDFETDYSSLKRECTVNLLSVFSHIINGMDL